MQDLPKVKTPGHKFHYPSAASELIPSPQKTKMPQFWISRVDMTMLSGEPGAQKGGLRAKSGPKVTAAYVGDN